MQALTNLDLLVVDDHELVRSGFCRLLADNPLIGTIVEASSGEAAVEIAATRRFDMVLMDITLPGISGLEASQRILRISPNTRIIALSGKLEGPHVRKLLNCGVKAYVTKGSSTTEMEKAIKAVANGEQYLSPDIAQTVAMDTLNGDSGNPFDKLTKRELEIATLLLDGNRNREIGKKLFISEKTVSTHRTRSFEKLGINSTAELVLLAYRYGMWSDE